MSGHLLAKWLAVWVCLGHTSLGLWILLSGVVQSGLKLASVPWVLPEMLQPCCPCSPPSTVVSGLTLSSTPPAAWARWSCVQPPSQKSQHHILSWKHGSTPHCQAGVGVNDPGSQQLSKEGEFQPSVHGNCSCWGLGNGELVLGRTVVFLPGWHNTHP